MKSILISVKPKYCELIASGEKTIEVRKTKPKLKEPFKVYIYETKGKTETPTFVDEDGHEIYQGRGQVIGEFVCDLITISHRDMRSYGLPKWEEILTKDDLYRSCLTYEDYNDYAKDNKEIYEWHISNLVIYDKPRELSEFVVEGDCLNGDCKKCKWFDGGNNYNVEADCLLPYDFHFNKSVKPLFRPPQSWMYCESEVDTK